MFKKKKKSQNHSSVFPWGITELRRKCIYSHIRNSSETDTLQKNYSKRLQLNALLPKLENEVINGLSKSMVV